jgi:hypothetical protein
MTLGLHEQSLTDQPCQSRKPDIGELVGEERVALVALGLAQRESLRIQ